MLRNENSNTTASATSTNNSSNDSNEFLPIGFEPRSNDILCGKGKSCYNWKGNQSFRAIVAKYLDRYSKTRSRREKSSYVNAIIATVQDRNGMFIREDKESGRWFRADELLIREKVGQAIREGLHSSYKSSTKSKKRRRQVVQAKATHSMNQLTETHELIRTTLATLATEVKTEVYSDEQLGELFTSANLKILNELNRVSEQQQQQQQEQQQQLQQPQLQQQQTQPFETSFLQTML